MNLNSIQLITREQSKPTHSAALLNLTHFYSLYRCGSWGSYVHLKDTGIILNNEMDDFSTPGKVNEFGLPPSPANYIVPLSRPISSMCPTILVDANGDAVLISGSAGGTKITTSVAFVSFRRIGRF